MSWLAAFAAKVLIKLLPWLTAKVMEFFHGLDEKKAAGESVDARLEAMKEAYKKAFDGTDITPEQREELKHAISDFIRGGTAGGM
jgi:hypothetical protein